MAYHPYHFVGEVLLHSVYSKEIKYSIHMGNACYYSLDKILSCHLLSKKFKVNTYKTIILLVVLYVCETWSLTVREELKLRVFQE